MTNTEQHCFYIKKFETDAGSKQQETVKNKLKNIVQDSRLFRSRFLLRGKSPSNFLAAT